MMTPLGTFLATTLLTCACLAQSRTYSGPRPAKPDLPYLAHADNLIETEAVEAREEQRKDANAYVTAGAASPVRTPLAEPIFLLLSEKLPPQKLTLFRMEVKGGNREIVFPAPGKKKVESPRPIRVLVTKLEEDLHRIEANEWLDNGEYCLSPDGSNRVFCFQVY
jgi:hypothetical protein